MAHRIEILTKVNDTRSEVMKGKIEGNGFKGKILDVKVVEVYTTDKDFTKHELNKIADALSNPISQTYTIDAPTHVEKFDFALEIGFLPGVTDNIATTARETIEDLLKKKFDFREGIYTSLLIFIHGNLNEKEVIQIGESLANKLIQRIHVKSHEKYASDKGMDRIISKVKLHEEIKVDEVSLDIPEEELAKLGKEGIPDKDGTRRGPLALDKPSLLAIKKYFKRENRKPTDVELESIAQTWSEHCKHTIFAAKIDNNAEGLYKGFIKKATNKIRKKLGKKDFCVSVFTDNSGAIVFDKDWLITDKMETHNSPSALDPFGGAITGIVGVNRDTIGFGRAAKPILNRYGYCVGDPNDKDPLFRDRDRKMDALSPKRILKGIVDGVNAGGNQSGIPTPQGFVYFDDSYKGKPLVFVGTVGLIPKKINGKPGYEKKAKSGDKIVVIGGRVGQDGIHGATFSSEALTAGSPATAVQIGDPITQKKLSDAIVKEARALNLYNSITDNGAGGLSCSVAEMAKECGGCEVDLDLVPLKYPNLEPWKIWISESQERMTLSVPGKKLKQFIDLINRRGVEATVIGKFTKANRCIVRYKGKKIMDVDMTFLHDGLPSKTLKTVYTKSKNKEPNFPTPSDLNETLKEMLQDLNICSFEFISHQYDHEVQGSSVIKPLQGKGKVNGTASIIKPLFDSEKGVVCSNGITAKYSEIDTYHMAACAIDTAIRNAVSVGGNVDYMAILDNFCWCSSDDPERLGQLKAASQACYDYSTVYNTPFISGKDSMFNDFKGYDKDGNQVKISVLPTLLVSSLGVVNDVTKAVSLDAKFPGDLVYVLGETKNELGASEYFHYQGKINNEKYIGNHVPEVDAKKALKLYQKFNEATEKQLIASSFSVGQGGIGAAISKKAIAGELGINIDLRKIPRAKGLDRDDYLLFSETQSRFVVTIDPKKKKDFEKMFKGFVLAQIGEVTDDNVLKIIGLNGNEIVHAPVFELSEAYKSTFKGY